MTETCPTISKDQMDTVRAAMLAEAMPRLTYRRWTAQYEHAGEKQKARDRDARRLVADMLGFDAYALAAALDALEASPARDAMEPATQARFVMLRCMRD